MLLIDSLYINQGGGLHLLDYLVNNLIAKNKPFFLLLDQRCGDKFDFVERKRVLPASLLQRKRFYKQSSHLFSVVLCFGNIPPQIKLSVPTYTYFHNINLLTLKEGKGVFNHLKQYLKRGVFRYYKNNTDYWLVQTSNTAIELVKNLKEKQEKVLLFPFYDLPSKLFEMSFIHHKKDYAFIGDYYNGAKGHDELLDAWDILHKKGYQLKLHLTVDTIHSSVIDRINSMRLRGVQIINHGTIPYKKVITIYGTTKAVVYPSHNESLGLGIIEAITAGCDLIGADLPYLYSICNPSAVFKPYSSASIAEIIMKYENEGAKRSELCIRNMIEDLINLLYFSNNK